MRWSLGITERKAALRSAELPVVNYYKHHIGDYAKKTAHLTVIEHGAAAGSWIADA